MAYHESFWVAVAAAAPVIALSATVLITENAKLGVRAITEFGYSFWEHTQKAGLITVWIGILNILFQGFALWFALQSLANGKDSGPTYFAIVAVVSGLVLIVTATRRNIRFLTNMTQYKIDTQPPKE
jgi:hypothetical protein